MAEVATGEAAAAVVATEAVAAAMVAVAAVTVEAAAVVAATVVVEEVCILKKTLVTVHFHVHTLLCYRFEDFRLSLYEAAEIEACGLWILYMIESGYLLATSILVHRDYQIFALESVVSNNIGCAM